MEEREIWRDIAGFEGWYQVSSLGGVRSLPREVAAPNRWGACTRTYPGVVLKQRAANFGYRNVGLRREGTVKVATVHRLVCEAFHGPCPPDKQHCAHNDGDPTNNRADNLRWATVRENSEDTRRHGNMRAGEASNLSRLTEADIIEMRRLHKERGLTKYRIAKMFGTSLTHASKIIDRRAWAHI